MKRLVRQLGGLMIACVIALIAHAPARAEEGAAIVRGRVSLDVAGADLSRLGPIVVYLEPIEANATFDVSREPVTIRQKNATFSPSFLTIASGQTVDMPNVDAIYHNVFSYSRPNDFDLGFYPAGESRQVRFEHAGVVKVYCSIHESMNATILVAPSPFFARVRGSGKFSIRGVVPGRYRVTTWCAKLPTVTREIELQAGDDVEVDLALTLSGG
jgi:plastocyanin